MNRIVLAATLLVMSTGRPSHSSEIVGTVKAEGVGRVTESVVFIDRIPGKEFPPPSSPVIVDQARLMFVPRVLPVLVGTTVEFRNSDDVLHNVFSPDTCTAHLALGTWSKGMVRSHVFDRPCSATLLCNVHPEMEGFVVTVETPYFAVTGPDGKYRITGVPPGKYTLRVWNEKVSAPPVRIIVHPEGIVEQDFVLSRRVGEK